mmetsp:Transcript_105407/g.187456  ORF Transcript_105407/g.187456 Transcript_105407/m.187456 type:complete len:814 (+) Transcript_105407:2003-4444(+)
MEARKTARKVSGSLRLVFYARSRVTGFVTVVSRVLRRSAVQGLREFAGQRRNAEWQRERHQESILGKRSEAARALGALLRGLRKAPLRWSMSRLEEAVRYDAVPRPQVSLRFSRVLARVVNSRLAASLNCWHRSANLGALRATAYRGQHLGELKSRSISKKLGLKAFNAWQARTVAPRRLGMALLVPATHRLSWAMRRLQSLSVRKAQAIQQQLYLISACRRVRRREVLSIFKAWRSDAEKEKLLRRGLRNHAARLGQRLSRLMFKAWLELDQYHRRIWRLGTVLHRAFGAAGLRTWRSQAACVAGSAVATSRDRTVLQKSLTRQKADCERLVEQRGRECAVRTAKVLLHGWRCAHAAENAFKAQRRCTARCLVRAVAGLERHGRRAALERWRACAMAGQAEVRAEREMGEKTEEDRMRCIRQGGLMLASLVQHRQRLALCQALIGNWRAKRWLSLVRTLDASSAREQRRLRADCDSLRVQLATSEDEALRAISLEADQAERSDHTREEASAILEAVRKERAAQADRVQQSEVAEAEAQETNLELVQELTQARSRATILEAERRSMSRELGVLRNELREARGAVEEAGQAEMQRERDFHEQAQALHERAINSGHEMMDAQREIRERAERVEKEVADRAKASEKALESLLQEKGRAIELQQSMADEQDRNIRHLEDLLKEQGQQMEREREDHSKGLDSLRASASFSESKTCLLQEQVVALRQQLQKEHSELRASERAWSSDRAALLSAVANQQLPTAIAAPRRSTEGSLRRSSSAKPREEKDGRMAQATASGGQHGRCPWHGRGAAGRIAPALM